MVPSKYQARQAASPWEREGTRRQGMGHGIEPDITGGGNMATIITRVNGKPVWANNADMLALLIVAMQIGALSAQARTWQRAQGWRQ